MLNITYDKQGTVYPVRAAKYMCYQTSKSALLMTFPIQKCITQREEFPLPFYLSGVERIISAPRGTRHNLMSFSLSKILEKNTGYHVSIQGYQG